jgi:hypothetical protein
MKKEKEGEAKKEPTSKKAEVKVETKVEAKPKLAKKVSPPAPKEPLVAFARWFTSKKFKPHWAAGMEAYTDTARRRTMTEWDRLFKNY